MKTFKISLKDTIELKDHKQRIIFGKVFLIFDLLKQDKFYESYLDFERFWLKQEILHLECLYFIDGRNFPF